MKHTLKLIGLLAVIALIAGCGQTSPTVNLSNNQPNGLKIKGMVREYNVSGSVAGGIVGAVVVLEGDSTTKTVVTNSAGEYLIEGIPDGTYNLLVTAEGYIGNQNAGVAFKSSMCVPADNTIVTSDIVLSANPIIISHSPAPNSVVASNQAFTVTFSKPMDTSTVMFDLAPTGLRSYLLVTPTGRTTVSWDSAGRVATVTPTTNMAMNTVYKLTVSSGAKDLKGYQILNYTSNAYRSLTLTPTYRVASGGVPGAPSGVVVTVNGMTIEAADYMSEFSNPSNTMSINWQPSPLENITGYRIYASKDGANYAILDVRTTNYGAFTIQAVINALYGAGTVLNPSRPVNYPFENFPVYFKVVAYNGDGESAGTVVSVQDKIGPKILGGGYKDSFVPFIDGNNYYVSDIASDECLLVTTSSLDESTLLPANFRITDDGSPVTITNVQYLADYLSGNLMSLIKIKSTSMLNTSGHTFVATIGTGVKDVAGNPVVVGTADTRTWNP